MSMPTDQYKNIPQLAVRQATLITRQSPVHTPIEAENSDTLAPLVFRGSSSQLTESVVQPGRVVQDPVSDIPGELIRGRTRYQGGYADVADGTWLAPDGIRRRVGIKYLREVKMESIKGDEVAKKRRNDIRMLREATIWQNIHHPNILPLYGFRSGDDPCLVAPWCENGNLEQYLQSHKELGQKDRLRLLAQAGRGLAYLHGCSPPIAHGDIKPANVLITDSFEAAFCDFGLARVLQSLENHTGLTTSNQGQGSRGFQAPELILGQDRPTTGSDVYAFGGLMLAVLSGKNPFWNIKSPGKIVISVSMGKSAQPADHPELPSNDPLWDILKKCWSFDPETRPTMGEIVAELEKQIALRP